jgi:hypothetical protein
MTKNQPVQQQPGPGTDFLEQVDPSVKPHQQPDSQVTRRLKHIIQPPLRDGSGRFANPNARNSK